MDSFIQVCISSSQKKLWKNGWALLDYILFVILNRVYRAAGTMLESNLHMILMSFCEQELAEIYYNVVLKMFCFHKRNGLV